MFNKIEYREMFSRVRASEGTRREVMNMTNSENNRSGNGFYGRKLAVLAAAVILLMAVTVTAFASESVQSWFVGFFAKRGESELTDEQVEYLVDNELTVLDSQTHDGWTVELRAAIQDGTTAYVIFRMVGPEDVNLSQWQDEEGNTWGGFVFGNMLKPEQGESRTELVTWPEDVYIQSWSFNWLNDGDGLPNTRSFVITLEPNMKFAKIDPYGDQAVYQFHMENIIWQAEDLEYRQELLNGKYAGQTNIMFTQEEIERLQYEKLLAEGVWEFSLCFAEEGNFDENSVELLTAPVSTESNVFRVTGPEIDDFVDEVDTVRLTSVRMNHLSVRFCYASMHGIPDLYLYEGDKIKVPLVVMLDGTTLRLQPQGNSGNGSVTFFAEQPIVFEDVDYLLLADGTIIDMPE